MIQMQHKGKVWLLSLVWVWLQCLPGATTSWAVSRGIHIESKTRQGQTKMVRLYSGYYALVVGCGDYQNGWPVLPNPVQDAREVSGLLGALGWEVKLLEDPDSVTLQRALLELISGPGRDKDKAVLFWYSGHGYTLKEADGNKLGYIVPVDVPDPVTDEMGFMERGIDMRQMETVAKRILAKHVLMVFDSCFSGAIFQMVRARPSPFIEEKVSQPVRQFITAGNENEQVPDRSTFKTVFLQAVREGYADRNRDGYVTGEELGVYLQEKVVNYSRSAQHPQFGKINNPKLDKGDFVFKLGTTRSSADEPVEEKVSEVIASREASGSHAGFSASPPDSAVLSVASSTAGAAVKVDGRNIGTIPMAPTPIAPGEHQIEVFRDGYAPYNKTVRFKKGQHLSLHVDLNRIEPQKAQLLVQTTPSEARVRILNIKPKFYQGMTLGPGRYHLEISSKGYHSQRQWVHLREGEKHELEVRLEPTAPNAGAKETNRFGMVFVYIPPGTYWMGSPLSEEDRNMDEVRHQVTLTKGFYLQANEVTQVQWEAMMGQNPSYFNNCGKNCPVEQVSFQNVLTFIQRLNKADGHRKYRLPTEAEWEYGCRAGTGTPFAFGECLSTGQSNHNGAYPLTGCPSGESRQKTLPVGSFSPNAWGLYDLHGNVREWCQDWYGPYPAGHLVDPHGPTKGSYRINRGGSWYYYSRYCRSADRHGTAPGYRDKRIGFRLVMSEP